MAIQGLSHQTVNSASMLKDATTAIKDSFNWLGRSVKDLGASLKDGFTSNVLPLIQTAWDKTIEGLKAVANFVKTPIGTAAALFGVSVGLILAATANEEQSKVSRFALGGVGAFALAGTGILAFSALA